MSFCPYLTFNGNCREAMTYYADVFGAKDLQIMSYGDAPPDGMSPSSTPTHVMHSQFTLGEVPLMGADSPPDWYKPQAGVSVFHGARTKAEAERVFTRLANGGSVTMPLEKTFWSDAFGMLTDRFGTSWMITLAPTA